jgi:hypothetical protein
MLVDQVRSGMQRPEVLSEAHFEPLPAAMTEEHWEAARLPTVVAEVAQDLPREAAKVREVAEAAQGAPREAAEVRVEPLAVVAEVAEGAPREAAEVRVEPLAAVAEVAQDVPQEAAEVRVEPLAVVAEVAQDVPQEAAEVRVEPLAVVAEVAQGAPQEAAEVRVEPLAAVAAQDAPREAAEVRVEPLAVVVSLVAPQAPFFLLAARLARQHKTLRLRGPKVMTFEGSRSQSLRAGSIEFVSWQPVPEKESNNVSFVSNDQLLIVRRQCGEVRGPRIILSNTRRNFIWELIDVHRHSQMTMDRC